MERRAFIHTAAAGAALLVVPSLAAGCAPVASLALRPWAGPPPGAADVRLRALAHAVLAPNAHNTQPWLLDLARPFEIALYVDRDRLLPETDPPFRQAHVSQGTFLELLDIAARELGHRPEIALFPGGDYGDSVVEDRPVAAVRLVPDPGVAKDPLFAQIPRRASNKRVYQGGRPLPAEALDALAGAAGAGEHEVRVITDPDVRARLAEVCRSAMAIEVASRARGEETARWFRFDDAEVEAKRDGFGVAQSGRTGFEKWFAESFLLSRRDAADPRGTFARGAVDQTRDQATSAAAFGLLSTRANTRRDQILAGRAYVRINLAATARGIAMHPLSQVLQEYPDMAALQQTFRTIAGVPAGHTVQMLFRLGLAEPAVHSPRREPTAMLRAPRGGST